MDFINYYWMYKYTSLLIFVLLSLSVYSQNTKEVADTLTGSTVIAAKKVSITAHSAPIQVLDKRKIENLGFQELSEAIKTFSGVNIKDYGGIGGLKTVSVRGMGSAHTSISFDGMAVSNVQSGQIDISKYNLDNVQQVVLTIGQSDNIFQAARLMASSTSLSVTSSVPDFTFQNTKASLTMRIGSFGTYNPSLEFQQKLSKQWSLGINGDYLSSEGNYPFTLKNSNDTSEKIRKNSDVESYRANINIYGNLGKAGNLLIKSNYYDSERGLPGSVILYNDDAYERLWDETASAAIKYDNNLGDQWKILTQYQYNYAYNKYYNKGLVYPNGFILDRYCQQEHYFSAAAKYSPFRNLHFSVAEDIIYNELDANTNNFAFPIRYTSLSSVAAQYRNKRFTATASLLGTYIKEKVEKGEPAPDRKKLSPSASVSYRIFRKHDLRVRLAYKDIFRVPTFNDLYYVRIGNNKLKPEKSKQFNLGLTWQGLVSYKAIDFCRISLDSYYNMVQDKIIALPSLFIWKMMNAGEVRISGMDVNSEIRLSLSPTMRLEFGANYTYQNAIDITYPDSKYYRHQIPYTPKHTGHLHLSWLNKWMNITYLLDANGERYSLPQNIESNKIAGYLDHSITINKVFDFKHLKLQLSGEALNLANTQYEIIQYYPMPRRSFRFTIKLTY